MFNNFHKAKLCILSQYTRISQGLPFLTPLLQTTIIHFPFLFPGSKRYVHRTHGHQVLMGHVYQKDRIPAQTGDRLFTHMMI